MDRFLSLCAKYIYSKHGNELHDICLVFPNRRAGVFFYSYLQKYLSRPVIAPCITQVNKLIYSYSDLICAEKLHLVSVLYNIFTSHVATDETFDDFYFWGEVLLSDFNDIDLYMVNAKDIFTNISDIKEIESLFDYLTKEQKEALAMFWGSLGDIEKKIHNKRFVNLWHKLYPVYSDFKKVLYKRGTGYSGMIYRQVVEELENRKLSFDYKKYYFIGLNALNSCEKAFFSYFRKYDKAVFLWDYNNYYLEDKYNEAGLFMRDNLMRFPPPGDFLISNGTYKNKKISVKAIASNHGQALEIPGFISRTGHTGGFDTTAVVLADESLLFPALGALPEDVKTVNVTMGYPVKDSVVYGFLLLLINLFKNRGKDKEGNSFIYHRFVTDILNHQLLGNAEPDKVNEFISRLKEKNRLTVPLNEINFSTIHKVIFDLPGDVKDYSTYFINVLTVLYETLKDTDPENHLPAEIIYTLFQGTEKLRSVVRETMEEQGVKISETVYFRLLGQYLGQLSVPFEGEPLKGIQVMGILETRCLDFDNVVILGFNENKWPRQFSSPSFIPYNIRKGFGMPGIDEQDAMYAYYFYRLIDRAKNITATYSTLKEGISTGELSRYGFQLLYDSNFNISSENMVFPFLGDPVPPVVIESSLRDREILIQNNSPDKPLSPTAINIYLQCRLRFYFRYILKLPEPDEVKDEIDSPVFGSIFHETMENLYLPFVGKEVTKSGLAEIKNRNKLTEEEILKALNKHYYKNDDHQNLRKPEGKTILIFENIKTFLKRLIETDIQLAPFRLISLEKKYVTRLDVNIGDRRLPVYLGGTIDRVDMINGTVRVMDYKTGNVDSLSFKDIAELFNKETEKPKKEILQSLLYCFILKENIGDNYPLIPAVYSLRDSFKDNFSTEIKFDRKNFYFQDIEEEFISQVKSLISEIFTCPPEYRQTSNERVCSYCPYKSICQRY